VLRDSCFIRRSLFKKWRPKCRMLFLLHIRDGKHRQGVHQNELEETNINCPNTFTRPYHGRQQPVNRPRAETEVWAALPLLAMQRCQHAALATLNKLLTRQPHHTHGAAKASMPFPACMAERCAIVPDVSGLQTLPSRTAISGPDTSPVTHSNHHASDPKSQHSMPVLEVTQLQLKGVAPTDPALLETLSSVRGILQTQSVFYSCVEDPTLVFILGLWESLEAHREFLASFRAAEVLGPQESMMEFRWSGHVELGAMAELPLGAPILAVERRRVRDGDVDAYVKAAVVEKGDLRERSRHEVVSGWRVDAAPGVREALVFTGWETAQDYAARQTTNYVNGQAATSATHEVLESYTARNMESPT
jgi:heme-degrading monooxygenase HmoA